jgi:hypothetical protein
MNSSEQLDQLATALAKAQAEMPPAEKNGFNPHFKSHFSTHEDLVNASRPSLTKNSLSVIQGCKRNDDKEIILYTRLMHASGQWIQSEDLINPIKTDPQGIGSFRTYMERYSYKALVGVVSSDEEDDAEYLRDQYKPTQTNGYQKTYQTTTQTQSVQHNGSLLRQGFEGQAISSQQLEQFNRKLTTHIELLGKMISSMKLDTLAQFPQSEFLKAMDRIDEHIKHCTKC